MKQISVVVADSSPFVCRLLKNYLESAPDIQVTGCAQKGHQLVELVASQRPDVVTLGLEMPDMTGLEALQATQQIRRTPAIIISGANLHAAAMTLEALHHGAVDFVCKFTPGAAVAPDYLRHEIIHKVRLAYTSHAPVKPSEAQLSESKPGTNAKLKKLLSGLGVTGTGFAITDLMVEAAPAQAAALEKVIVIGASTGGPVALQQFLSLFPADFAGSLLVVQHLPATFTAVLAEQLQRQLALPIKEAEAGDRLQEAAVLITPGGMQLLLQADGAVQLREATETESNRPSINLTMQSVAAVYGTNARGVLLTGTGNDGVAGMAAIRQRGGTTFAQSPETCTAKGMPQRAIEAGVVDIVAPPEEIARLLMVGY